MIDCIYQTNLFKELALTDKHHAYLLYSQDRIKNNEIALAFAKKILCETNSGCGECNACKQFVSRSHPDLFILEQDAIKVDDVKILIEKLSTKPIQASKKVFVILNAETINEIAQNKLLKSLEEPNESAVFILTTTKTDKLLPTVLSRLNKIFVPNLSKEDEDIIANELNNNGINISSYIHKGFTLTEMINFASDGEYLNCLNEIKNIFSSLNSTADIPNVVSSLNITNKPLFFSILQELLLSALKNDGKFDDDVLQPIKTKFSAKAIMKCLPLIDDAYKKLMSNVNFGYILDNLLFNMLKERFLCK